MSKTTKKSIKYNEPILEVLQKKYGYSIDYIRKSLRGDRYGIMPDKIIKDYKILEKEHKQIDANAKQALIDKANNLN